MISETDDERWHGMNVTWCFVFKLVIHVKYRSIYKTLAG